MDKHHSDLLIAALPKLRAYATILTRNSDAAADLVQDVSVKALKSWPQFTPGTNFNGWLYCIMRTSFLSDVRKRRRVMEDIDSTTNAHLAYPANQEGHVMLMQTRAVLESLPAAHRDALLMVGVIGWDYRETAQKLGCPIGTIKSRVSRARSEIMAQLMAA